MHSPAFTTVMHLPLAMTPQCGHDLHHQIVSCGCALVFMMANCTCWWGIASLQEHLQCICIDWISATLCHFAHTFFRVQCIITFILRWSLRLLCHNKVEIHDHVFSKSSTTQLAEIISVYVIWLERIAWYESWCPHVHVVVRLPLGSPICLLLLLLNHSLVICVSVHVP